MSDIQFLSAPHTHTQYHVALKKEREKKMKDVKAAPSDLIPPRPPNPACPALFPESFQVYFFFIQQFQTSGCIT